MVVRVLLLKSFFYLIIILLLTYNFTYQHHLQYYNVKEYNFTL